MTDPLRERHRICSPFNSEGPFQHCICAHAPDIYPCDTIKALDERDAAIADADQLAEALRSLAMAWLTFDTDYDRFTSAMDGCDAALRAHDEATR